MKFYNFFQRLINYLVILIVLLFTLALEFPKESLILPFGKIKVVFPENNPDLTVPVNQTLVLSLLISVLETSLTFALNKFVNMPKVNVKSDFFSDTLLSNPYPELHSK